MMENVNVEELLEEEKLKKEKSEEFIPSENEFNTDEDDCTSDVLSHEYTGNIPSPATEISNSDADDPGDSDYSPSTPRSKGPMEEKPVTETEMEKLSLEKVESQSKENDDLTCHICIGGKPFHNKYNLSRHIQSMHKTPAPASNELDAYAVHEHQRTIQPASKASPNDKRFKCPFLCPRTFLRADGLKRHIDSVHSEVDETIFSSEDEIRCNVPETQKPSASTRPLRSNTKLVHSPVRRKRISTSTSASENETVKPPLSTPESILPPPSCPPEVMENNEILKHDVGWNNKAEPLPSSVEKADIDGPTGISDYVANTKSLPRPTIQYKFPQSKRKRLKLPNNSSLRSIAEQGIGTKLDTNKVKEIGGQFQCYVCGNMFAFINNLYTHFNSFHASERRFKCSLCEKAYNESYRLERHFKSVHAPERQFKCSLCKKEYVDAYRLRLHIASFHYGRKDNKCLKCRNTYACSTSLLRHLRVHHPDWTDWESTWKNGFEIANVEIPPPSKLICTDRDKTVDRSRRIASTHHSRLGKAYRCIKCFSSYTMSSNLWRHIRRSHPDWEDWRETWKQGFPENINQFSGRGFHSNHGKTVNWMTSIEETPEKEMNVENDNEDDGGFLSYMRTLKKQPYVNDKIVRLQMEEENQKVLVEINKDLLLQFLNPVTITSSPGPFESKNYKRRSEETNGRPKKIKIKRKSKTSDVVADVNIETNADLLSVSEVPVINDVIYRKPKKLSVKRKLKMSAVATTEVKIETDADPVSVSKVPVTNDAIYRKPIKLPLKRKLKTSAVATTEAKVETDTDPIAFAKVPVANDVAYRKSRKLPVKKKLKTNAVVATEIKIETNTVADPSSVAEVLVTNNDVLTIVKTETDANPVAVAAVPVTDNDLANIKIEINAGQLATVVPVTDNNHTTNEKLAYQKYSYGCKICNIDFPNSKTRNEHLTECHLELLIKCNVCNRAFQSQNNLDLHMRIHTGERPHRCGICQKAFTRRETLRSHMRLHSNTLRFKCSDCPRTFLRENFLNNHIRKHHASSTSAIPTTAPTTPCLEETPKIHRTY